MKKFLWFVILAGIVVKLSIYIASNQNYFLRKFDPVYMGNLYSQSQYVIGERSKGGIGDDGLYAFAGYYYLFQKGDVSSVNFEHPPLGKYLIGLSILLFGNENIINIIYFLFLLLLTYKLSQILLSDRILSVLSVGILSLDSLFLDNLVRSLLDLPFTLFFVGGVYFFLLGLKKSRFLYLSFIFLGAAFSTRFFPVLLIICLYLLLIIIVFQRKSIKTFIKASFLIPIIYLISHISFFFYHPSVVEFLRHKKWMLAWFTGTPIITGNIWRNIFTGWYIDSTGKLVVNEHWMLVVPVVVVFAMVSIFHVIPNLFRNLSVNRQILKQVQDDFEHRANLGIIYGLCIIFLLYITVLTGGLQKFLMPIYPILIILAVGNCASLYSIINAWLKRSLPQSKGKL